MAPQPGHAAHASVRPRSRPAPGDTTSLEAFIHAASPQGIYDYVFDKANGRFLLSKGYDKNFLPDSDVASGRNLWIQMPDGTERLVAESVYRAKFSPDGTKIAYTTSTGELRVEDLNGSQLGEVKNAYEVNWRPDGEAIAFAKVPEGRPFHMPEVLQLSVFDLKTQTVKSLTNGQWDDVRPDFHPSGKAVLFVSGARSGLASFWQVPAEGGEPVQVTNVGLEQVNDLFVPTPYDRTLWSRDNRWFVYDYKNGEQQETWGLEFDAQGRLKKTFKLGDGLNPQWRDDGHTIVAMKDGKPVEYQLP